MMSLQILGAVMTYFLLIVQYATPASDESSDTSKNVTWTFNTTVTTSIVY